MATASLGGTLRKVFDRVRDDAGHGDGELLTRYRTLRDQDAFGSLVRRHGPMVLGVCRRVLRDYHAADDAFQATFLVLAKKADAVRPPDRLAPWLYGVAYRTALKARGRAFRRQQVEQDYAAEASRPTQPPADETADLLPIIDEQLNALPEKYRTPLVLCGIQGLNKAEAAAKLGLPEGTVSSRLARAREMLRERLTRRGVAVPVAVFAALLTADTLQAAVSPTLMASASGIAASAAVPATILTLSHEVISSMTLLKLKFLGVIALSVSLAGGGVGLVALQAQDKKPQPVPGDVKKPQSLPSDPVKKPAADDPVKRPQPDGLPAWFNEYDTDKDGQLSLSEWRKAGGKLEDFQKMDLNGDGFITADELLRFKQKTAPDGEKPAKPGAEKPAAKFAGRVVATDTQANTIMLTTAKDPLGMTLSKTVIKLAPDSKVFVDGKETKLADVPKGVYAGVMFLPPKDGVKEQVAGEVRITGSTSGGILSKADETCIIFTSGKNTQIIKLGASTTVTIDGKEAKPTDLQVGCKVIVTLTSDETSVLTINANSVTPPGEKPAKPAPKFGGRVSAVDATARTISVHGKGGNDIVVKLTADAKITVDRKDAKLADVPNEAIVTFTLSATKDGRPEEANAVAVTGSEFGGTVKEIDATNITIANPKRDVTLKLLPGTKVTIDGKDAKLADLKIGDTVTVTRSADESGALAISGGIAKPAGDKPKPGKGNPDEEN